MFYFLLDEQGLKIKDQGPCCCKSDAGLHNNFILFYLCFSLFTKIPKPHTIYPHLVYVLLIYLARFFIQETKVKSSEQNCSLLGLQLKENPREDEEGPLVQLALDVLVAYSLNLLLAEAENANLKNRKPKFQICNRSSYSVK